MKIRHSPPRLTGRHQQGAILVVGLIVLMLITLMVAAAFKFSTYNLKSVGNMQSRNEAIASANKAIEQVLGNWDFASEPKADFVEVDIDNDGTNDYAVNVAKPVCIKATAVASGSKPNSDCRYNLDGSMTCPAATPSAYNAVWELDATATASGSGTKVRVRQGVSKPLSQDQCSELCPPAPGAKCS